MTHDSVPSKSKARKAGSTLRRYQQGRATEEEAEQARAVVDAYRRSFSGPLKAVYSTLAAILKEYAVDGEVSQRLKRMQTIVDKITVRESGIDLSRMQDIGGCRVVLGSDSLEELRRLEALVCERWEVKDRDDYVSRPRESGYRALHIIVVQDGRLIEIQLRTQAMHQWAQLVEDFSSVLGANYKQDGVSLVQDYARVLSRVYIALERNEPPSSEDQRRLDDLSSQIAALVEKEEDRGSQD
ncbi:RelA/SpoT domain-containing protein [Actinomyces wuliandei]|uniref:RelA/SpoT domain-containing protein n=1 Tax=Actinomyces wuliandei TaxID=2057743 RepID=UPI000FDC18CB|nr:RelA/SpoT domain-containing protein [Actinomyces wuliandei]